MTTPETELLPCPFESKINKTESCWIWTGAFQSKGYGNYRSQLAHRISYEKYIGKIPEGLTLDHLCKNPACVNPQHLEPVTQYENNMRGDTITAINKRKTHCINGHEFSEENIKIVKRKDGVRRKCMLCDKIYKRNKRNIYRPTAPQNAEALEALDNLKAYVFNGSLINPSPFFQTIRAALQSPDRPYIAKEDGSIEQVPARPVIKPLVWVEGAKKSVYRASPVPTVHYRIAEQQDGYEVWYYNGDFLEYRETLEQAKAAAEAHWQAKIGECLV